MSRVSRSSGATISVLIFWMSCKIVCIIGSIFGCLLCAQVSAQDPPVDPDELAKELRRIPPREPAEALKSFRLKEGFEIQLVAAEPDVVDPVAMTFDEDGRMLVVEMRDYPFEPGKGQSPEQNARAKSGRVRLLEDLDGDAKVDRSVVYAEGFTWPTGIIAWKGGAFVAAAPAIFYLRDENGDGVAERREVVYSGFGTQNVQALLNSLCWGLDNQIWGSGGGNGGEIRSASGGGVVSLRGRDFRFRPSDSAVRCGLIEAVSGGGQFGMCFDDWGRRFVCNNSNHIRVVAIESRYLARNQQFAAPGAIVDVAEDGSAAPVFRASTAEPWRLVRTRWRAASAEKSRFAATELVPTGFFTSATGIHIYRGDAFPREFRGDAFVGDVGANLVHRKVVEPKGTLFSAHRPRGEEASELLVSTDNWFRPVGFAEGPEGALYVLDMYRETIEHPASIPESIKRFVDLKSGDDRGRIYRIVPTGFQRQPRPKLSKATTSELVATLDHPAAWWRESAQRLLVERGASDAEEPLRSLAREGLNPLARLHALWTLQGLGALRPAHLEHAFADREAGVREAAVRLAEDFIARGTGTELLRKVCGLADDSDLRVRWQVALSLGASRSGEATDALAKIASRDASDEWMRTAVLCSVQGRETELVSRILRDAPIVASSGHDTLLRMLSAAVGSAGAIGPARSFLVGIQNAGMERQQEPLSRASLQGLSEGLRSAGSSLSAVLTDPPPELGPAIAAVRELFGQAARRIKDGQVGEAERIEWVRLLGNAEFSQAAPVLSSLLDPREPGVVQLAALAALSSFAEPEIGKLLVEKWKGFSPPLKREAVEAMFRRKERIPMLLDGIESGLIAASDLEPERRKRLLSELEAGPRERARALLGSAGSSDRAQVIERYRLALTSQGDPSKGQAAFKRVCATCHRLGAEGHVVAPDLKTVRDRTPESLLIHILDPNREVAPPFVAYSIVTADGRALSGIIAAESDASVTLRRAEGVEETVLRNQIERLESSGLSLMPEGLEKDLTIEDMAHLIALILASTDK